MADVRLFGRVYPHGGAVESIRVRVRAANMPDGAQATVTDLQLQPGPMVTGYTPHPSDMGVQPVAGWQWRNGVVSGARTLVVVADAPSASPCVTDVREAAGDVTAGGYRFGRVEGSARVDGWGHEATQGAGLPPYLTARSDVDVPVEVGGRALVTIAFRGLATSDGALEPPPETGCEAGVIRDHPTWADCLAVHETWESVLANHPDWDGPSRSTVTGAHKTWGAVLAAHPTWGSTIETHQEW
jgi:hypothetical protein